MILKSDIIYSFVSSFFVCLRITEADELQVKILSILNGEVKPEGAKESVAPNSSKDSKKDKSGKLMVKVPLPSEPLGTDPKVESAINSLMDPSFISVIMQCD